MATCMTQHMSEELVAEVDRALGEAIRKIEDASAAKVSVSLSFDVSPDDDGKPEVSFTHKNTTTRKGSWSPTNNPRLPGLR